MNMRYSSLTFSCLVVVIVVPLIMRSLTKEIKYKNDYKKLFVMNISWLRKASIIYIICVFILTILMNLAKSLELYENILLICCMIVAIFLLIASRFRILVDGDKIIYTPMFSKTKEYNLKDITLIQIKENQYGIVTYLVYIGEKRIFGISNMLKNAEEFINLTRANNIKFEHVNKIKNQGKKKL